MELNERSGRVLAALVREYIATGEPVPSSVLVHAAGLGVSSATVRNILGKLEEDGYVQQPHTSAGRVPTDRGYRFYVDLLLEAKRSNRTAHAVEARLRQGATPLVEQLLSQASHVLLVSLSLYARWGLAGLEGIGDEDKALVQECADLRVSCGDQCEIGLLLVFCHNDLL